MTSYAFIKDRIKPHQSPSVFNSNAAAVLALKNKQINGLVVCSGGEGRRSVASALASTVVFFGIVVSAVTHAPGLPQVRTQFFNRHEFRSTFPEIARAFGLNIKIFCIAEVFILVFALFLAVLRSLPGAGVLPVARARDRVRRPLPRHHDDPCDRAARLRRAGARTERHPELARPDLQRVRLRGLPGGYRLDPFEPGGGRAVAGHWRARPLRHVILCAAALFVEIAR